MNILSQKLGELVIRQRWDITIYGMYSIRAVFGRMLGFDLVMPLPLSYTRRGKTWACFNACRFLPVCTTPLIFFLWAPTCVYIDHKKIRCRQTKTFCLVGYWRYRTLFRFTSSHSEITSRKLFSIKDGQKVIWQIFYEDIKFCPWFLTHFEKQNSKIDRKISEKSRFSAAGVPYSIVLSIHPASP